MHITLLVNRDLASNVALNNLLPDLSEAHDLTLYYSERVGHPPSNHALATLEFFEQTLPNHILFPLIDHRQQRGELATFKALETYLLRPMQSLNDPNSRQGLDQLRQDSPDLVLSIRYGRILHQAAIDIPKLGVLNLHSGRLPDYRGVMATFRSMLKMDTDLCTTLHWIENASIDTGRIVGIQCAPRKPNACYLMNVLGLYQSGCRAIIGAIERLESGEPLSGTPPEQWGDYYSFPEAETLRQFHEAGHRLVDPEALTHFLSSYRNSAS